MTDIAASDEPTPKGGKKTLLIGVILAFLLALGSFFGLKATVFKVATGPAEKLVDDAEDSSEKVEDFAFVALDPMVISLSGAQEHLRFTGQLEVEAESQDTVRLLIPRIVDVLGDYLRAVSSDQLAQSDSLLLLKSQMLRRAQVVVGPGKVRDLLIMEFVLN